MPADAVRLALMAAADGQLPWGARRRHPRPPEALDVDGRVTASVSMQHPSLGSPADMTHRRRMRNREWLRRRPHLSCWPLCEPVGFTSINDAASSYKHTTSHKHATSHNDSAAYSDAIGYVW